MNRSNPARRARAILALAAAVSLAATAVDAASVHTGSEAGAYHRDFCPGVQAALEREYFDHQCKASAGTLANVEAVRASPVDVGIGQLDIVARLPEETLAELEVVDANLGHECLFAVTSDPAITTLSSLSHRVPLALPSEGSGSVGTFRTLQTLDDGLASLSNVTHFPDALGAVSAVAAGKAVLAFFVQSADTSNPVFKAAADAGLSFVPVINRQILREELDGLALFEPMEVGVVPTGLLARVTGKPAPTVKTACTKVVLFTGAGGTFAGTEAADQAALVGALATAERPKGGRWDDITANLMALKAGALEGLLN